mmetsp:Transcript_1070/g.1444  ORF Transcript_1070/g.1444 Transcript_1070/m.1444 type:complete len:289 (-) Transcript_1070:208-1074(-)
MPFNKDFASKLDNGLFGALRLSGCFNEDCRALTASSKCSKCGIAVYCSRKCQVADWKDKHDPHKRICQVYCNNTNPKDWKGPKGQHFPVPVGLAAVGLLPVDDVWMAMKTRADLFFHEVNRLIKANGEGRGKNISLIVNVMYNLERPILQAGVNFYDPERTGLSNDIPGCFETAYYILFAPIGESGEHIRQRLHPSFGGCGEISKQMRLRAIKELKGFIQKVNEHGLHVDVVTYSRGLMWMSDDDFRHGAAKDIEEANSGKSIGWNANLEYAMKDSFHKASQAAFGCI